MSTTSPKATTVRKGRASRNRGIKSAPKPPASASTLILDSVVKHREDLSSKSIPDIVGMDASTNATVSAALGYIPGNAVRIAHWDDEGNDDSADQSTTVTTTSTTSTTTTALHPPLCAPCTRVPSVLLLYPLCVRPINVKKKKKGTSQKLTSEDVGMKSGARTGSGSGSGDADNDVRPEADYEYGGRKRRRRGAQNSPQSNWSVAIDLSNSTTVYSTVDRGVETGYIVEPFPTIYWLVSSRWRRLASILEDKHNGVKVLQERLKSLGKEGVMTQAHDGYVQHLSKTLREEDHAYIQRFHASWFPATRGVGGLRREGGGLRCLHMHLAHWLGGQGDGGEFNIIGKWTEEWALEIERAEAKQLLEGGEETV